MNRREQMRLVDEGVALVESLNAGTLSRRDELKAVDRMLVIIELLGGDAAPEGQVGTDAPTVDYAAMIAIAADSVQNLRKADVFRVLDEAAAENRQGLAEFIKSNRAELTDEVEDALGEINGNGSSGAANDGGINPLYQSVLDGAEITRTLIEAMIEEAQKDDTHPQLRPATKIVVEKVEQKVDAAA